MRKDNINDRYRIYLGAKAKALTVAHCPPGELPGSDDLEAGIEALQQALEVERGVLRRLQDEFDRLDGRMVNLVSRRAAARSARPALSVRPREDSQLSGRRLGVLSDHAWLRHNRLGEKGGAPAAPGREGIMAPVTSACGRN